MNLWLIILSQLIGYGSIRVFLFVFVVEFGRAAAGDAFAAQGVHTFVPQHVHAVIQPRLGLFEDDLSGIVHELHLAVIVRRGTADKEVFFIAFFRILLNGFVILLLYEFCRILKVRSINVVDWFRDRPRWHRDHYSVMLFDEHPPADGLPVLTVARWRRLVYRVPALWLLLLFMLRVSATLRCFLI